MKKLKVLILLILVSLSGFSQTDTTKVRIEERIARLVAKDLIMGDGCFQEMTLLQKKIEKMKEKEIEYQTAISLLEEKDKNNNFMLGKKDNQLQTSTDLNKKLESELKKERRKTSGWKIITGAVAVASTYLLLTK